jgi:hypothetical protein
MVHAGLDLSRKRLDICLLDDGGEHLDQLTVSPDVDSLRTLARRIEQVNALLHRGEKAALSRFPPVRAGAGRQIAR